MSDPAGIITSSTAPWWGRFALIAVLGVMFMLSSCTVLISLDDAEVVSADAEATKARMAADVAESKAELEIEQARLATLERLIEQHNYGPVAARCAVEGWERSSQTREACERANSLHEAAKK